MHKIIVAFAAGLLLVPATAQAADVSIGDAGQLAYAAAPGEVNSPAFTETSSGGVVEDPTATLTSADGSCEISAGGHTATCASPDGVVGLAAQLGDEADSATVDVTGPGPADRDAPQSLRVDGGAGDDTLVGSDTTADMLSGDAGDDTLRGRGDGDPEVDPGQYPYPGYPWEGSWTDKGNELDGGDGDDTLAGGAGEDSLEGEAGNDVFTDEDGLVGMSGGAGDDRFARTATVGDQDPSHAAIHGGDGSDTIAYEVTDAGGQPSSQGAKIRLTQGGTTTDNGLPGQFDRLTDLENAVGTKGDDYIEGTRTTTRLRGLAGNDKIVAHVERAEVEGGDGSDSLDVGDGEQGDRVACGDRDGGDPGDTVRADAGDSVERCPAATGPPATTTTPPADGGTPKPAPPAADTTPPDLGGTALARRITRSSLRRRGYRLTVRSADATPVRLLATLKGRVKGKLVTLARVERAFTGSATVRLRPRAKLRRTLRRGARLRLTVEVRDAAGNAATRTARVRVR